MRIRVNFQNLPKFELFPETWKYEGGIACNRG